MKSFFVGGMSILLVLLCANGLFARSSDAGRGPGPTGDGCDRLVDLKLSEKQLEAVRKTETIYREPIFRLRKAMMFKHIDLRNLLQDPESSEETIRSKAREIETLQKELRQNTIDYQIALRAILTPDQIRRWCTMVGGGFQARKGSRWP